MILMILSKSHESKTLKLAKKTFWSNQEVSFFPLSKRYHHSPSIYNLTYYVLIIIHLQMEKILMGGKKQAIVMVLILLELIKVQIGDHPNPLPPTPLSRRLVSFPQQNDPEILKELLRKARECISRCIITCGRQYHPNSHAYELCYERCVHDCMLHAT